MAEVLGFRVWVDGGQVDRDSFVTLMYFAYPNRSDLLRLRVGTRMRRSAPHTRRSGRMAPRAEAAEATESRSGLGG